MNIKKITMCAGVAIAASTFIALAGPTSSCGSSSDHASNAKMMNVSYEKADIVDTAVAAGDLLIELDIQA